MTDGSSLERPLGSIKTVKGRKIFRRKKTREMNTKQKGDERVGRMTGDREEAGETAAAREKTWVTGAEEGGGERGVPVSYFQRSVPRVTRSKTTRGTEPSPPTNTDETFGCSTR